ncbi:hypothetical protein M9H77_31098 [Catharanthus roseus]|uniref:Uncharacterized protein n=1 Tax=Catharanthus roseus TaxID=4058 RepID=A0ACC0A310_CATRO|nr:hypothetical protein M9H77_31098 [Catharanthus roseus]
MAKSRNSSLSVFLFLFFLSSILTIQVKGEELGRKVGGRMKIQDVKTNKEVQELGRYCVEEYNRGLRNKHHQKSNGRAAVVFAEVVEAERQVVSGIKYYLKISAISAVSGVPKTFTAIVVVKPWAHSKELLNFSPSPATK